MSREEELSRIRQYIRDTRVAILTYVREDLTPVSRAMGSFAPDGHDLLFSTGKETAKVREIERNRVVSFYFEHDGQVSESWTSVLLIGEARPVEEGTADHASAVSLLAAKSPRFRERVEKGALHETSIYRIVAREIERLDRTIAREPFRLVFDA